MRFWQLLCFWLFVFLVLYCRSNLEEGCLHAGQDVGHAVKDDQHVDPCSFLSQDDHPGPQVDDQS